MNYLTQKTKKARKKVYSVCKISVNISKMSDKELLSNPKYVVIVVQSDTITVTKTIWN